jgi:hypothetical protein
LNSHMVDGIFEGFDDGLEEGAGEKLLTLL